jgi:HEAT repeat protein
MLSGLGFVLVLPVVAAAQVAPPPPVPPVPPPAPLPPVIWTRPDVVMPVAVAPVDVDMVWQAQTATELVERAREARTVRTFDFDFGFRGLPQSPDRSDYSSGLSYLQRRNYEQAIARFDRAIARAGSHTDGALYWKAFAEYKLGRTDDALATIATLRQNHAQSRYLGDAKMLEADVRQLAGQRLSAEQIAAMDDEQIKILAIQGIQRSNPEGAIPLLEGVLQATNSLQVKRRALYVLALSDQPRARQILLNYAKGAGNPDLQMEAIKYVAANREHPSISADLRQIYESTEDQAVRLAIIAAYRSSGNKNALIQLISTTSEPIVIRQQAVSRLSGIATPQDLWALYQKETNRDLRLQMVAAFSSMGATDQLNQIARTEEDAAVRQRAIRYLGGRKTEDTGETLVALYGSNPDAETRKAVIAALASQSNAEGLVAIARKEASLELKTEIVSRLSSLAPKSKVAADYLLEIIK